MNEVEEKKNQIKTSNYISKKVLVSAENKHLFVWVICLGFDMLFF